jgi:hypothetical protein
MRVMVEAGIASDWFKFNRLYFSKKQYLKRAKLFIIKM